MGFGIYIHIPFCKQKCFYCDFASTAKKVDETLYEQYINALCQEITMYQALFPDICIDTIYFGGGTPSILPPDLIIRALNTVKANFILSSDIEITLEANPGTVDEQKLQYLYQNGINQKESLGFCRGQSFDFPLLKVRSATKRSLPIWP